MSNYGSLSLGVGEEEEEEEDGPNIITVTQYQINQWTSQGERVCAYKWSVVNYFFVWRGVQRKKNEATITLIGNSICFELRTDWEKSAKECCGNCNIDTEWGFISLSGDPINHLWVGVNWISSTIGQFSCSLWVSEWVVDWMGDPISGTNLGHNKWGSLTVDWLFNHNYDRSSCWRVMASGRQYYK